MRSSVSGWSLPSYPEPTSLPPKKRGLLNFLAVSLVLAMIGSASFLLFAGTSPHQQVTAKVGKQHDSIYSKDEPSLQPRRGTSFSEVDKPAGTRVRGGLGVSEIGVFCGG